MTEKARWDELVAAYHAAQHALTSQIAGWLADARSRLAEIDTSLEKRVRDAGVPEEQVVDRSGRGLAPPFVRVRSRLGEESPSYSQARGLLSALSAAELSLKPKIAEIRARIGYATARTRRTCAGRRSAVQRGLLLGRILTTC